MSGSVHIVIVNWNAGTYLRDCLESVVSAASGIDLRRVTIVDNASTDGSADGLEDLSLPLEIARNDINLGFAAGCNQGAAGSDADYLLFLNPDTRLLPETLTKAVEFMDSEAAELVGICGGRVMHPDGGPAISCGRFPTLRILLGKMTGLDRLAPRLFPTHHLSPAETQASRPVDQVIGAFFLVRRDLFDRLGGFDTRYYIYFEEVDLALRAREQGYRSYFLSDAPLIHIERVSSDQVIDLRLFHSLRSRLIYALRHWPRHQTVTLTLMTFGFELPARLLVALARGDRATAGATLTAYRNLARELPSIRRVAAEA